LETSEVVTAIEQGTTQIGEGANVVEDAKLSLGQILEVSHQIDYLIQSIITATASQTQTSQTVVSLLKEVAQASERTADSSGMVSRSLQQTLEVAQQLQESVGVFKTGAHSE
jgi:twitching motility protein PilJ